MAIDLPPFAAHPNRAPFRGVLTLVDTPSDSAPAGGRGHRVLITRAAAERAIPSLLGMALDYAPSLDRHDARRKVGIITEANVISARVSASAAAPEKSTSGAKALEFLGAATAGLKACSTHLKSAGKKACSTPLSAAGSRPSALESRKRPDAVSRLEIAGYIYAHDFPDLMRELNAQREIAGQTRAPHKLGMSYEIADARIDDLKAPIWTITEFTFTGAAILRRDKAAYRSTWIELL